MKHAYKPLRNLARSFSRDHSVLDVWCLMQHVGANATLPKVFQHPIDPRTGSSIDLRRHLPPFKVELLLREILLHAGPPQAAARTLRRGDDLVHLANSIQQFGELTSGHADGTRQLDIMVTLYLIGHQQLYWQRERMNRVIGRSCHIYGAPIMEAVMIEMTGLTMPQYTALSLLTISSAFEAPRWQRRSNYQNFGVSDQAASTFFDRISRNCEDQRAMLIAEQVLDVGWEYTWNPIREFPLIPMGPNGTYACPITQHLIWRLFSGIYFDLCNGSNFGNAIGASFEAYVGTTIRRGYPASEMVTTDRYGSSRRPRDGSDWIVSDSSANAFIECKNKRLRKDARTLKHPHILSADLDVLADAVVQNYLNICDAEEGLTNWKPNGLPTFSIILTLEDWTIFSRRTQQDLHESICSKLAQKELQGSIRERVPYLIVSAPDVEELSFAWSEAGIYSVLSKKCTEPHMEWMMSAFLHDQFPSSIASAAQMFEPERKEMIQRIAQLLPVSSQ